MTTHKDALTDLRAAVKILTAIEVISDIAPGNESGPIMRVQVLTLRALDNLRLQAQTLPLFTKEILCQAKDSNSKSSEDHGKAMIAALTPTAPPPHRSPKP